MKETGDGSNELAEERGDNEASSFTGCGAYPPACSVGGFKAVSRVRLVQSKFFTVTDVYTPLLPHPEGCGQGCRHAGNPINGECVDVLVWST